MPSLKAQRDPHEEKTVLTAFLNALNQESHTLQAHPESLWQQMYNRLQWAGSETTGHLEPQKQARIRPSEKPWLHQSIPPSHTTDYRRTLKGHTKRVTRCLFTPDGTRLITSSRDGTIKIWDTGSWKESLTLYDNGRRIIYIELSPNGKWLVSKSQTNQYKIWNLTTGKEVQTLSGKNYSLTPNGYIAHLDQGVLRFLSITDGKAQRIFQHQDAPIQRWCIHPAGHRVLTEDTQHNVIIWSGYPLRSRRSRNQIYRVKSLNNIGILKKHYFIPNSNWIFSVGDHKVTYQKYTQNFVLWEPTFQKKPVHRAIEKRLTENNTAISPDGRFVIMENKDNFAVWDIQNMTWRPPLEKLDQSSRSSVQFCADGRCLISQTKGLALWDITSGKLVGYIDTGEIEHFSLSPDSQWLATVDRSDEIKIRDASTWQNASDLSPKVVHLSNGIDISDQNRPTYGPDGSWYVTMSWKNNNITLWDSETSRPIHQQPCSLSKVGGGPFFRFVMSVYSPWLIIGIDAGRVHKTIVFGIKDHNLEENHTLEDQNNSVNLKTVSTDGSRIFYADNDQITIWNTARGQEEKVLETGHKMNPRPEFRSILCAISPDECWLVTASNEDRIIKRWNTADWSELDHLEWHQINIRGLLVSPDGTHIIAFGPKEMLFWNITTNKTIQIKSSYISRSRQVKFSPDSQWFLSSSESEIKVWDANTIQERFSLPQMKNGEITPDGQWLLTRDDSNHLHGWDPSSGKHIWQTHFPFSGQLHPWKPQILTMNAETYDICGLRYGPIIVTAQEYQGEVSIRCPACLEDQSLDYEQLGKTIKCQNPGCELLLRINSFVIKLSENLRGKD